MKSTRKSLLIGCALLAGLAFAARAADLTPFTGPQDPSQLNANLNTLERNIQTGVNGLIASQASTVSATGTTVEQNLYSQVIPATLSKAGQSLRLRCAGQTAHNGNTKTIKLYYGTSVFTSPAITTSAVNWDMELLVTYNASATSGKIVGRGTYGLPTASGTVMSPLATANTTDNMAGNLTAKCTATLGTASAQDVELMDFYIEQIK